MLNWKNNHFILWSSWWEPHDPLWTSSVCHIQFRYIPNSENPKICAKLFAFWFSNRGIWLILTESKHFKREFIVKKYFIRFSLIHLYSFLNFFTTSSRSPFISTLFSPKSNKILRPATKASYSASFLKQWTLIWNLKFVGISFGEIMRIPTHVPSLCLEHRSTISKVSYSHNFMLPRLMSGW